MQNAGSSRNKQLAVANIIVFVIMIATNYLAVTLPLNNKTTGQLSDQYPNKFTPAGFTFSIWGIIYLFLAGFIIYQANALVNNRPVAEKIKSISGLFIVNGLANAGWLFAWHYEQVALSVVIMLIMLFTLIRIHSKLHLAMTWKQTSEKLFLDIPFSIYLGWISIATIANITALLVAHGIQPFEISATIWTLIMIVIAAILTTYMTWRYGNIFFALVAIWALFGILMKRKDVGGIGSGDIILVCYACMAIIAVMIILSIARKPVIKKGLAD